MFTLLRNSFNLLNMNVHSEVHKSPPLALNMSHIHPVNAIRSYFLLRSFLVLSTHPHTGLTSGVFPSGFPTTTLYSPLLSPICATCLSHLILLHLKTRIIWGAGDKPWSFSLRNLLQSSVTFSSFGPSIFLNTLCRKHNVCVLPIV